MSSNIIPPHRSLRFYRALADKSFFHFVRMVGGPKSGRDICPELFIPICQFVQDHNIPRKFVFMPRDFLKTTVITKWLTIWEYLQNPEIRQLIVSENELIAANFLHWIERTILTNKRLRILYQDKLNMVDENWTRKHRWSGTACDLPRRGIYSEPSISVIGVGGAAQSRHFDYIHIDDLIGRKALESPQVMEGVFRWFDNIEELLVEPDISKPNCSIITGVGTHWGPADFGVYVQDKYPIYKWRIVPALKNDDLIDIHNQDGLEVVWIQNPNVNHDESNWPEYRSTEYYHEMRASAEKQLVFWSQHMNDPQRATGLNKIEKEWIRFYHWEERDSGKYLVCEDEKKEEFKLSEIPLVGIIDPGGFAETKMLKKGSNNAILIGGQPRNTIKKFVVYTWAGKLKDPEDFQDEIFKAHKQWRPRQWRIETFGAQDYIYRDILLERKKRGVPLVISPLPKDVSKGVKDAEIQALIPVIANGELYVHRSMRQLISELINYPVGLTNDLADCLAKLFKYHMTRKKRESIEYINQETDYTEIGRSPVTGY